MSTQRKADFVDERLSEGAVHDYLKCNPDFFERHSGLLGILRLPHVTGGTVSLVERQVSVLRQKDLKLERKLKDLLDVARANDLLTAKLHQLTLQLLAAGSLADTLGALETALRTGFSADQSILVLFGDPASFDDIRAGRFFKAVERDDPSLKAFDTFLNSHNPRCGQVRDVQRDFLFGRDTDEVGSAALIPLGKKAEVGFLAIGSVDKDRFHPGMSVDFLKRLGQLVAEALRRY
ncbi:MAG: DUF484 family protein [Gammaproteobacteria bacterium]|nr:DUF484 family protein [Gammaproteobacteria bacterium]MDH4314453.1 DUF484 family protein [Gammaproteobacteria bacterium]MDH5213302.1 DUF484 family protein [Gammaproteobacteria bacterium]MDH5499825.1 DUF484 family protein [Gammaproteobacteria bacterium]